MRQRPQFLGVVLAFGMLEAGLVFVAVLLAGAALDATAHMPDPNDDSAWTRLASRVVAWKEIDASEGQSPEAVVALLGPPLRVRRPDPVFERCAQTYLYAVGENSVRHAVGLCFNRDGLMDGIVGGRDGGSFDVVIVCGPGGFLGPALLGCLLGLPVAVVSALRRHRKASLSSAMAGPPR